RLFGVEGGGQGPDPDRRPPLRRSRRARLRDRAGRRRHCALEEGRRDVRRRGGRPGGARDGRAGAAAGAGRAHQLPGARARAPPHRLAPRRQRRLVRPTRFGIWHDFRNPPKWAVPYDRLYRENLEQIVWAEQLGFESVWVSEHHVTDDGYLPSVFPLLAAIAVRTTRMKLGSAILLGPFQHPVRLAEGVAAVDQLSGGARESRLRGGVRDRGGRCVRRAP